VIYDTFMINRDLDMLECRLVELENVPNVMHVAVEADVDHQDHPKPYYLSENLDRFAPWKERLIVVRATGLPTAADAPDPWAREHAQREFVVEGLADADPDDVVMHGDIDEIPTALVVRNLRPQGILGMAQRGHFWSCRWLYPVPWSGTVACRIRDVQSFARLRDARTAVKQLPNAGWHLSWLPNGDATNAEAAVAKVGSYCHPEVTDRILAGLKDETFLRAGVHVDGVKMLRCEIDRSFPRYVYEGRCPSSWTL